MGKRIKLWTRILVISILLNGSVISGGMKVKATDEVSGEQIPVIQASDGWCELENGTLTLHGNVSASEIKDKKNGVKEVIAAEGTVLPSDCSYLFSGYISCRAIDLSKADASNVTNMEGMFRILEDSLHSDFATMDGVLKRIDLSNCNTSNVTNMKDMFRNCNALTSLDLSSFDTGNVTNMKEMFKGCLNLESVNLSSFDTSKVTDMNGMFRLCWCLTSLDLSNFNTSKVTDMSRMFEQCSVTELDISNFNTSKVTNMYNMFNRCNVTELDLSNFNTSNVTDMSSMFSYCKNLKSLDLSTFDTSKVTNMYSMFVECISLTSLNLSNFNTSKVTNMNSMFKDCQSLTSLDLSSFNTSGCRERIPYVGGGTEDIFCNVNALRVLKLGKEYGYIYTYHKLPNPVGGWAKDSPDGECISGDKEYAYIENEGVNTYYTKNQLFVDKDGVLLLDGKVNKEYLPKLSGTTKKIIVSEGTVLPSDCSYLFSGFSICESIDLSNADTSNVTNMARMFYECSYLQTIKLENIDTSNVTNMEGMFFECENLRKLDLSGLDTRKATNMSEMFNNVEALQVLKLGSGFEEIKIDAKLYNGVGGWAKDSADGECISGNERYAVIENKGTNTYYKRKTANINNDGELVLQGNVTRTVKESFKDVDKIIAYKGAVLPSDCSGLFAGFNGRSIDLSNADTSNVTNMMKMFYDCRNLETIKLENFDTSNVTNMESAFHGCDELQSLDLSSFDTSNVKNMKWMFAGCQKLQALDLSNFNTRSVEDMMHMFHGCYILQTLKLEHFDTNRVTSMYYMFRDCRELKTLDLSCFDTSNVKNLGYMFYGCSSLQTLDLSNFTVKCDTYNMFGECNSLNLMYLGKGFIAVEERSQLPNGPHGWARDAVNEDRISGDGAYAAFSNSGNNVFYKKVHIYDEPTYEWSYDNSNVTAKKICLYDKTHVFSQNVFTTYEIIKCPTESEAGIGRFTATFTEEGFVNQTKDVEIPKLDPIPSRGDVTKVFLDIPVGEWYVGAVQYVYDRDIMHGVSGTAFGPKGVLTREQFITVLYNMEGAPDIEFKQIFDDVKNEANVWYAKSVTWAAENNITSGVGGGLFGTGKEITREQLATLLYNYAQQKEEYKLTIDENAVANFPDVSQISTWASDGMKWAVTNGVMGGKTGKDGQNFLDPQGKATRAECAQMIKNLKEKAVK